MAVGINIKEDSLQAHIVKTLRKLKALRRLDFVIGMQGIRLQPYQRNRIKSQGMESGQPDILILMPKGKMIAIELKVGKNKPQPNQLDCHDLWRELGYDVHLVTTSCLDDGLNQVIGIINGIIS